MAILDYLLGRPLASSEEDEQKIGPATGVAVLGLDSLSSAAYGPEAALTVLLPLGTLGLLYIGPLSAIILAVLAILYFSYRQTMAAYPDGGGSYTVAKENLGSAPGRLAAAALMLDYVMNVAVGISAGVGALVSAFPVLHDHIVGLCLIILTLIALINLRGARESGVALGIPTIVFVVTLFSVLGIGITKTILSGGNPTPVVAPPALTTTTIGAVSLWLLMRAFAAGCAAMTGVEAVSNGVTAFARPAVQNAQKTLTWIVVILGGLLAGVAYLSRVYHIGATDPAEPGYQSVLSQLISAVTGRGVFYYVTIGSVLTVLALSANTSFAGFPRLCRLLALDNYLPHIFASRGRRLVYTQGIVILSVLAAILLVGFGGITDRLIPLFAVGAFLAFTLSQAGMVVYWRKQAAQGQGKPISLLVNGVGCVVTLVALGIVLATKFLEGAWITVLLMPALLVLFQRVKQHYADVATEIACTADHCANFTDLQPPVVIVPIKGWNRIAERALRFALTLSPNVIAVHIAADEAEAAETRQQWEDQVVQPIRDAGHTVPQLVVLESPYRKLFTPLLGYIEKVKNEYPADRQIAVIIPELVESAWYQYPLHNQRATGLKAALLLRGDARIVVINVPWYLKGNVPASRPSPAVAPSPPAPSPQG